MKYQRGFSGPEILIGMALLGIVAIIVVQVMLYSKTTVNFADSRREVLEVVNELRALLSNGTMCTQNLANLESPYFTGGPVRFSRIQYFPSGTEFLTAGQKKGRGAVAQIRLDGFQALGSQNEFRADLNLIFDQASISNAPPQLTKKITLFVNTVLQEGKTKFVSCSTESQTRSSHVGISGKATIPQSSRAPASDIFAFKSQNLPVVKFDRVDWDQIGDFNSNTGTFVPKIAGKYRVQAQVTAGPFEPKDGRDQFIIFLRKNDSIEAAGNLATDSPEQKYLTSVVSTIIDANGSTDNFQIVAYQDDGSARNIVSGTNATVLSIELLR